MTDQATKDLADRSVPLSIKQGASYLVVDTLDDRYTHSPGSSWEELDGLLLVTDPELECGVAYEMERVRWWQMVYAGVAGQRQTSGMSS